MDGHVACPVCNRYYLKEKIEEHVDKCLFLNNQNEPTKLSTAVNEKTPAMKRVASFSGSFTPEKRPKLNSNPNISKASSNVAETQPQSSNSAAKCSTKEGASSERIPLAEQMRPFSFDSFVGHTESFGAGSMLRSMIEHKKIPNMILWGPPGCGKTSMANVICKICVEQKNMRFVKLSATLAGINDVREVVKVAKTDEYAKKQTVLFMDEIHRFNKLQQDTFLPHVEKGTLILIGATTENPSFSINNALLSRCKVVVMEKLTIDNVMLILERAIEINKEAVVIDSKDNFEGRADCDVPKYLVERAVLQWLAEVCDGDARVALGALELALAARAAGPRPEPGPAVLSLDDIQNGIKRTHMLYDRRGEEHYNTISALQKSIRAGDDNAALYWTTRALHGGEDPLYVARRLVRTASEDVGLAEPSAMVEAVACLQGVARVGLPEADVLLAQLAVRLARAPKSRALHDAMQRCQRSLTQAKGPLPPVPLHLRNATSDLMKRIGYGKNYNLLHKDKSELHYMPEGMEDVDFFHEVDEDGR